MTLTKHRIAENLSFQFDLPKSQSINLTDNIIEIIKSTLEFGEDVQISGFGKFTVKEKKDRKGRNPATGQDIMLPPRRVVTFKCSGKLRDKINGR